MRVLRSNQCGLLVDYNSCKRGVPALNTSVLVSSSVCASICAYFDVFFVCFHSLLQKMLLLPRGPRGPLSYQDPIISGPTV
ncbi:hypothetical protein CDAR_549691 [Caerostris darwini]|uniref:Uncharacterized protein n=1 Tax=Caerostris darwini TaxID=1538125 RepID=A0AAV4T8R4_9ARAC|nr:hypothetical protein CDAR_549691 [Caerostris darwini]